MLKLKISQRALFLFVIVSVTPVLALNTYWLATQQQVLRKEAEQRQILLTESAAARTDNFILQKLNALILHSQSASILKEDKSETELQLKQYILQDKDIKNILLVDKNGDTVFDITPEDSDAFYKEKLKQLDTATAFKLVTFLGGKEYISPLTYIEDKPHILIAVPLTTFKNAQDFSKLSTSERGVIRSSEDVNGALLLVIDLSGVWQSVFANNDNSPTFSYIVDDKKRLVGHPDQAYARSHSDLSEVEPVSYFIDKNKDASRTIEAEGLNKDRTLSTYATVPTTNWTVITEEPIENIEKAANLIASRVWIMNIFFAIGAIILSYIFSRRITKPIQKLAADANEMGQGNFDNQIVVKSTDEIGMLGQSLNSMAEKIKVMIEKIKADKKQLDVVLNSIDEGVFALDRSGRIQLVNTPALQLFNSMEQQLINQPFSTLASFRQDMNQVTVDVNAIDIKADGVTEFKDLQFTDTAGKSRYIDIIVARLPKLEGDIEYIVTVIDQTSSRELEAMKVDFVSLAAHELRTPLTAIRGYVELLLKDKNPELDEKHRRFLLQANDSSSQLGSLINNLLNVSKIERNAMKMSMDKMDWTKMVQSSVQNLQFSSEKAKISLTYEGPESGVDAIGDSVSLREVIDNLIANAIHYTQEKGSVVVRIKQENGQTITSVQDTGIGIPESSVNKLFTKFFRVHGGLATGSGGSGLGLYISKSIVESHGGKIWVESQEGVGSTFSFSLPAFDQAKYEELKNSAEHNPVRRKHGWTTKNPAR